MQRRQKVTRKHPPTTRPSPVLHQFADRTLYQFENRPATEDIREQLRSCLEQLEHIRLTSDLQVQKRMLLEQQLKNAVQESDQQRADNDQLKRELTKLSKKYSKIKEKKECSKCKNHEDLSLKLDKQRQIYANDRKMMQDQVKSLRVEVDSSEATQERDRLLVLTDSLYREIQLANKKIEQQTRIVNFLNQKLSQFEMENIEVVKNIDLLQTKLSQIQIDSILHKKRVCANCANRSRQKPDDTFSSASRSRPRRNGSIQNVKKTERDECGLQLQRYEP